MNIGDAAARSLKWSLITNNTSLCLSTTMAVRLLSKGNSCAIRGVSSIGALQPVAPLLNIVRSMTGFGEKERADEKNFISKEEKRHMQELREELEKEVKAIFKGHIS